MILSKANILAVLAATTDKTMHVLRTLHIARAGYTVAASERGVIVVDAPRAEIAATAAQVLRDVSGACEATVTAETAKEVLKNLPADTLYGGALEHCSFNGSAFAMTDGKRTRSISAKLYPRAYVNYRSELRAALCDAVSARGVFDLKKLSDMFAALQRITGNCALFVEFTRNGSLVLRCEDKRLQQRVLAIVKSIPAARIEWRERSSFEKQFVKSKKLAKRQ